MPWAAISGCSLRYQAASKTCATLSPCDNKGPLPLCDRRRVLMTAVLSGTFETRGTADEVAPRLRWNRILFANLRETDSSRARRWSSSNRASAEAISSVDALLEKSLRRVPCNAFFSSPAIFLRSGKKPRAGCVFGNSRQSAIPNFHHTERRRTCLISLSIESTSVRTGGLPGFKASRTAAIRLDTSSRRCCNGF